MFAASMSQGQTMIYNIYPYNNEKRVERERGRERTADRDRCGRKRNIVNTTYQSVFGSSITNRV